MHISYANYLPGLYGWGGPLVPAGWAGGGDEVVRRVDETAIAAWADFNLDTLTVVTTIQMARRSEERW